jgi:plastocyanin
MSGRQGAGRRGAGLLGLVLACGALTGCGGDAPQEDTGAVAAPGVGEVTTGPDGVQEITLQTQDDYVFVPDRFTVDPGRVRVTVVNVAEQMTHNFVFTPGAGPEEIPEGISLLAPGGEETVEFTVEAPGDHSFECSFHAQLGQVGTMTVRSR